MLELKRKILRDMDWGLVLAPIALTVFGCVGIYSAAPGADFWKKQIISLFVGLAVGTALAFSDYKKIIANTAPFLYIAVIFLLVLVLTPLGVTINGNRAWLRIAGFSLQPSEFAKLTTILMLARYVAQRGSMLHLAERGGLSVKDMAIMAAIVAPPVMLIALEKDTGTMLTFGAILGAFYFLAGMRKVLVVALLVALPLGLIAVYPHLKHYQQERIKVIFNSSNVDPRGFGYQTIQSKIAVGSGGLFGKGITHGTQGRLGFLPYPYSDFIAAQIAEETGFAGVLLMIGLYLFLLWRLCLVAHGARDRAGALMVMGFVAVLAFHITCNLGMVVALMPIMGIPLPLMSLGGTAVIATFAGIGLALSVRLNRFVN
jgi:rod shape determining protein RodA